MDIQTALVCVGVAVVSAVVLFAISMFGMKEKTYEEAIAEQRKMPEENLLLGRSSKDKVKDKKQKKAVKKVKEKPVEREKPEAPVVTPVPPQEKVHVDFEEPEAEVVSERPPQEEKKKKKIKEKVKPILLNKDEPVLIVEEPPAPANHFEEILPKDDLLLKRKGSKEEINIKPPVVETETSLDAPVIEAPKQAAAKQVVIKMDQAAPRNKKKKSELATLQQMSGEAVNMNVLQLMVRKAELSRSEIQILIDQLLNKQQGSTTGNSEWIEGRQDPMVKLKKQLAEKEKALVEEQEAAQGVQSRLKELRGELNAERSRSRQLEESLVAKQNELTAIATRLQHQVESHQALTQQNQQLQAKLNEERLILQQELHKQAEIRISHITEQHQEAEASLNAQIGQLHAQLQEREGINAALNAELQKLNEIMGENKMLMDQIPHLEGQIRHLENQSEELARQNEELHHLKSELEHHVSNARQVEATLQYEAKSLREELEEKCAALADLQAEVSRLRVDNEQLSSQVSLIKELQIEVQRLRDENDRLASQVTALSQLELEAQQLREENESLAAQVTAVTERPAAEGRENGDVHFSDEKEFAEFTPSKEKALIENEKLIEQLAEELKEKTSLVEKLNSEIDTYKTEINVLNEKYETQCKKNEELRTKNWKVLDVLSVTEKELESKVLESKRIVSEARAEGQAATKRLLERIFPDIKVDNTKSHEAWLEKFEQAVKSFVSQLKSAQSSSSMSEDHSAMLIELEKQNSQLQAMVTHYKAIIEDTEGMLNKLQSHVEQEEARWRQQLQVKETELESIREERDRLEQTLDHLHSSEEMQTKLEELQDKLNVEEQEKKKLIQHYEDQLSQEKSRLATELEKSQDMYKEIVKLRSLVQIGQDSLSQEQQMVQQLQQQLNGVTQNSLNGPAQESTVAESLSTSPQPLSETTEKRPKSKKKKTPCARPRRFTGNLDPQNFVSRCVEEVSGGSGRK